MDTFEPRAAVRFGWETFKKRPWFFIGTFLLISFLSNLTVQSEPSPEVPVTAGYISGMIVAGIIFAIISTVAKMGGNIFMLKAHDAPDTVAFKDMWAPHPFWRFVGTMILKAGIVSGPIVLVVLVGLFGFFAASDAVFGVAILLGIPALAWLVYASVRLSFSEMVVMDQRLMPVEALKASYKMTEGKFMLLVRLYVWFVGVMLLGLLALFVGLVVAIPVVSIAFAYTYRKLRLA